jgi:pimeloyl-ACP methyl ester carboxylesterase
VLADLLSRTGADSYVLVGHSLGARAMVITAQTMGSNPNGPKVEAVHLLGAAIGARSDWSTLAEAVSDSVYNYHSSRDAVLKYLYAAAQLGQTAAGFSGLTPSSRKLKNIDVSAIVDGHSDYHAAVTLR